MSQTKYAASATHSPVVDIPCIEPSFNGSNKKFAITVARFNSHITEPLLKGAYETLKENGVSGKDITVAWVPGAFELPIASQKFAASGKYHAVIAIGCVIRGETTHYDYVCNEAAQGIRQASLETGVPILFGVLTTENVQQAEARAGFDGSGNKGAEIALAAIEMANLLKHVS